MRSGLAICHEQACRATASVPAGRFPPLFPNNNIHLATEPNQQAQEPFHGYIPDVIRYYTFNETDLSIICQRRGSKPPLASR